MPPQHMFLNFVVLSKGLGRPIIMQMTVLDENKLCDADIVKVIYLQD